MPIREPQIDGICISGIRFSAPRRDLAVDLRLPESFVERATVDPLASPAISGDLSPEVPDLLLLPELEIAHRPVTANLCPPVPDTVACSPALGYTCNHQVRCPNTSCSKTLRLRLHSDHLNRRLNVVCPRCGTQFGASSEALAATKDIRLDVEPLLVPEAVSIECQPFTTYILDCENDDCEGVFRVYIPVREERQRVRVKCPRCGSKSDRTLRQHQAIVDLSDWIIQQLVVPPMVPVDLLTTRLPRAGKAYKRGADDGLLQGKLFDTESPPVTERVKSNTDRPKRDRPETIDVFDLVLPLLLPPLDIDSDAPVAFPAGKTLRPFQRVGVRFLAETQRALLADEMGLGKSIQAIVAIRLLVRSGAVKRVVILSPKSVVTDWEKKLWDWAPELRVVRVQGTQENRRVKWLTAGHVYLTTYETLRQDLPKSPRPPGDTRDFVPTDPDLIVLDEAQKIKNPGADVTRAVRRVDAPRRWALSGTPLENRLEELVSIFSYLTPGLVPPARAHHAWYIQQTIRPHFLRRRKADVLPDLAPKVVDEAWLELLPDQRQAYDRAEEDGVIALNEIGETVTVQHVLALVTKLKQICNFDPQSGESAKLEYLAEQLADMTEQDGNHKALVFSQYPDKTLKRLQPRLAGFGPSIFDGSLSDRQRDRVITRFRDGDECKVLLMSVKSGGTGITLTEANYVYHFDLWWNPAVAAQAEDRAHRIGQEKTVFVTYLYAADTIEERIYDLLQRKRQLFSAIVDDLSDSNLGQSLTEEELFSLFDISRSKSTPTSNTDASVADLEATSLDHLSPQEFEAAIADLYRSMGYAAKLTPQTRDHGIDVLAKRTTESGTEVLGIQCKHYFGGIVGVEHARSLYGVIQAEPEITRGVLVTTGSFSRECGEFAAGKRIELFDGAYVTGLMQRYR